MPPTLTRKPALPPPNFPGSHPYLADMMRFICNFALGVEAEIRPWGSWGRVSVNCTWDKCTLGSQQGGALGGRASFQKSRPPGISKHDAVWKQGLCRC